MSSCMSVLMHEALSSNIAKILSIANLKKFGHLINCPQNEFFPNILAVCIVQEYELCFFENFDPLHAAGVTFKWQTCAKFDPHPAKMEKISKNFKRNFVYNKIL